MPKCFIRTSRTYRGRVSQDIDDGARNHHRTVTRSGRRYVKPALPQLSKYRGLTTTRCRDRLDDTQISQCSILQTSPKFKYRQKCNPWSQLSVVTRFYLGRQFPQLDVTGLKPRERPVWPDDFPCRWSRPFDDDFLLRSDQACSPSSDHGDTELAPGPDDNDRAKSVETNPHHFCPVSRVSSLSESTPSSYIEKLTALRLRPEPSKASTNSVVLGPFRIDKSTKDLKLTEIKNLTGVDGKVLAKVFTIKSQNAPQNQATDEKLNSGVMTIQLPVSVKSTLTTPVTRRSHYSSEQPKFVIKGENSVWTKPIKLHSSQSTPGRVETCSEEVENAMVSGKGVTAIKPRSKSLSPSASKSCDKEIIRDSPPIPVIKIISTDKLGNTDRHYKCTDCGRVFTVLTALTSHMRTHSRQRNKCDECGKVFTRSWLLKGHMRTHTGERPFLCPEPGCDKAFADKSNLRSHLLIHTVTTKSFVCQKCGRAFAQKRYLHKHMLEVCRLVPDGM